MSNKRAQPSMRRARKFLSLRARKLKGALYVCAFATLSALAASCAGGGDEARRGVIIVNAPVAGEVRRVLVREGMVVGAGTPVVEIAVRTEAQEGSVPQTKAEDPVARAGRNIGAAQAGIEAARAAAVRAEVEVQRLTPLVASGDAPQAQLDGARAEYERAQRRLQEAQSAAADAQSGLVAARRQPQNNAAPPVAPAEQIVAAEAAGAGTVSVVSARVGDRVTAGQPLATLRAAQ
jgi:multidrug efflux pump subunit AcrA (membrane-fusion protein)